MFNCIGCRGLIEAHHSSVTIAVKPGVTYAVGKDLLAQASATAWCWYIIRIVTAYPVSGGPVILSAVALEPTAGVAQAADAGGGAEQGVPGVDPMGASWCAWPVQDAWVIACPLLLSGPSPRSSHTFVAFAAASTIASYVCHQVFGVLLSLVRCPKLLVFMQS